MASTSSSSSYDPLQGVSVEGVSSSPLFNEPATFGQAPTNDAATAKAARTALLNVKKQSETPSAPFTVLSLDSNESTPAVEQGEVDLNASRTSSNSISKRLDEVIGQSSGQQVSDAEKPASAPARTVVAHPSKREILRNNQRVEDPKITAQKIIEAPKKAEREFWKSAGYLLLAAVLVGVGMAVFVVLSHKFLLLASLLLVLALVLSFRSLYAMRQRLIQMDSYLEEGQKLIKAHPKVAKTVAQEKSKKMHAVLAAEGFVQNGDLDANDEGGEDVSDDDKSIYQPLVSPPVAQAPGPHDPLTVFNDPAAYNNPTSAALISSLVSEEK